MNIDKIVELRKAIQKAEIELRLNRISLDAMGPCPEDADCKEDIMSGEKYCCADRQWYYGCPKWNLLSAKVALEKQIADYHTQIVKLKLEDRK